MLVTKDIEDTEIPLCAVDRCKYEESTDDDYDEEEECEEEEFDLDELLSAIDISIEVFLNTIYQHPVLNFTMESFNILITFIIKFQKLIFEYNIGKFFEIMRQHTILFPDTTFEILSSTNIGNEDNNDSLSILDFFMLNIHQSRALQLMIMDMIIYYPESKETIFKEANIKSILDRCKEMPSITPFLCDSLTFFDHSDSFVVNLLNIFKESFDIESHNFDNILHFFNHFIMRYSILPINPYYLVSKIFSAENVRSYFYLYEDSTRFQEIIVFLSNYIANTNDLSYKFFEVIMLYLEILQQYNLTKQIIIIIKALILMLTKKEIDISYFSEPVISCLIQLSANSIFNFHEHQLITNLIIIIFIEVDKSSKLYFLSHHYNEVFYLTQNYAINNKTPYEIDIMGRFILSALECGKNEILDSDWLEVITEYAYNIINANIDQSTKEMYNIIYDILTEES